MFVSLFFVISGGKAIYEFVPRSEPVGLILPLIPGIVLLAAGIGVLLRKEWARQVISVSCWLGLAALCFLMIAFSIRVGSGISMAKFLFGFVSCLLGSLLYWWMLSVVRSETIRSWIKNETRA